MERAIEPEEERPGALQDEEDYLALFISRSLEGDSSFGEMVPAGPEHSGPEIKYSKFLTSYARLDLGAAERERRRESAFAVDDAVAGDDAGARIGVQSISDRARRARRADHARNLTVSCDLAARYELHRFIYVFEKAHVHLYAIVSRRADCVNGRAPQTRVRLARRISRGINARKVDTCPIF